MVSHEELCPPADLGASCCGLLLRVTVIGMEALRPCPVGLLVAVDRGTKRLDVAGCAFLLAAGREDLEPGTAKLSRDQTLLSSNLPLCSWALMIWGAGRGDYFFRRAYKVARSMPSLGSSGARTKSRLCHQFGRAGGGREDSLALLAQLAPRPHVAVEGYRFDAEFCAELRHRGIAAAFAGVRASRKIGG